MVKKNSVYVSSLGLTEADVTPEPIYHSRRAVIKKLGGAASGVLLGACSAEEWVAASERPAEYSPAADALDYTRVDRSGNSTFYTDETLTPYADIVRYNNFYEFGTDKRDPARNAGEMKTDPWTVQVSGLVGKPGNYALEDILAGQALEERIYRLRCVEAWSMVIPWVGVPLSAIIKRLQPRGDAKYVAFRTLHDPEQMPGQRARFGSVDWPYIEGLRMDEALHPLTIVAVGLYGKVLPNQNGAPLRLVVPWKYGFKSIKSIVGMHFQEQQPATTWNLSAPQEYGFFANVNPEVDHPRWSQSSERRLPSSLWEPNRVDTQMFNGYAEQVAHLYRGMNLRQNF